MVARSVSPLPREEAAAMYPGLQVRVRPNHPAIIMAQSGETVTYAELERRSNRLAHFLRARGLRRLDHYAIFMENNARYVECCSAGERAGLYYTCVNSYLTPDELTYILDNSESKILITSAAKLEVALKALAQCPRIERCLVVDGPGDGTRVVNLDAAVSGFLDTPIADEALGAAMLYSSGTTGRPKGILRPLPEQLPAQQLPIAQFFTEAWRFRDGITHLSPAPLYHAAPLVALALTIRTGGTAIVMERFDPEQFLALVERYCVVHSLLVPTMFSRMLKLPDEVRRRYNVSSLEAVIHGAAPCPVPVKEQMIEWWGPIIHEYYAATEGHCLVMCDSAEWLVHRGTVGRVLLGELQVLDEDMQPVVTGSPGTLWFKTASEFEYFKDPAKTREARSARRDDEHGRRCRLRRRGRLRLPNRSAHLHDHLRRGERLSAGMREPADYPPPGRRRGGVRRA
jgi:long-chain acyl-CoA synthetase